MNYEKNKSLENVPGGELVSAGLKDIAEGRYDTVGAFLVLMAEPRLHSLGFDISRHPMHDPPEVIHQRLYELIQKSFPDAYSRYNAVKRRLVSFCNVMESSE